MIKQSKNKSDKQKYLGHSYLNAMKNEAKFTDLLSIIRIYMKLKYSEVYVYLQKEIIIGVLKLLEKRKRHLSNFSYSMTYLKP